MTISGAGTPRGAASPWRRLTARRHRVAAIAAIAAVTAGSLAFWLAGGGGSGPQTTIVRNGEVWLQGEITQDTYPSISDGGGWITVNGYEVFAIRGNSWWVPGTPAPGTATGLNAATDQTGSHADVYARLIGPHLASILSAPKYYVRISG